MSTTLLYHDNKDVKIVSGPMFCPCDQSSLCDALDEPCVVTLNTFRVVSFSNFSISSSHVKFKKKTIETKFQELI